MATGYGEDLIRTAFGLDEGIVETVAHFRGAKAFDPDVSFILDIGGQDMKAIFVRDGHIYNIELNEACSSGCGTFIQTFARSMGYSVADFAQMACTSSAPCDLGTRCTVFMNSRIKQALKEAAEVGDISAGLAYSVIKNALHKVLRITDTAVLGEHIVVQGGTFRNPAVHRAFEKLLGREVLCPDIAELMGAYGAALRARDTWLSNGVGPSRFVGLEALARAADYDKRMIGCRGCENRCTVTKLTFPNGGVFVTGNRCERIYSNHGERFVRGTSLHRPEARTAFRPRHRAGGAGQSDPRRAARDEHVRELPVLEHPARRVRLQGPAFRFLQPRAVRERGRVGDVGEHLLSRQDRARPHPEPDRKAAWIASSTRWSWPSAASSSTPSNSYNCPVVTGYPDVIRSAMDPLGKHGIPLDMPSVTFRDEKLLREACYRYLRGLGVGRGQFRRAFERALAAQREYEKPSRRPA